MSLFRSERMGYYTISMSKESSWEIMNELGSTDLVQFIDQNPTLGTYQRSFAKDVKRIEDIETNLNYLLEQIKQSKEHQVLLKKCENLQVYLQNYNRFLQTRNKAQFTYLSEIEQDVLEKKQGLILQQKNLDEMTSKLQSFQDYKEVLSKCKNILEENQYYKNKIISGDDEEQSQIKDNKEQIVEYDQSFGKGLGLSYIAGVISQEDLLRFKRIIFRSTKGNNWIITIPIVYPPEYDTQGNKVQRNVDKNVFLIVYQSGEKDILKKKINRICDSFNVARYGLPQEASQFMNKILQIDQQIVELQGLIKMTQSNISKLLYYWVNVKSGFDCSYIEDLQLYCAKEKQLYQNMNMLEIKNTIYIGYFWCPMDEFDKVKNVLNELQRRKPELPPGTLQALERSENSVPPSYFKMNEFTSPFQEIVNTYGIPRYREVNPGIFAISMFPYKFGIMFGDMGHGGVLLSLAIYLCFQAEKLRGGAMDALIEIRYLLLIMGIFAVFAGLIYNEFFSLPWNLFGSCYSRNENGEIIAEKDCVYPIGIDPKWYISTNELTYVNSFKMKLAVIVGVIQMIFGILMKGVNAVHYSSAIDFIFEFIPQLIFMCCSFGYMILLIMIKWTTDYSGSNTCKAPSIIAYMIALPLAWGDPGDLKLYENQQAVQVVLLELCLISVPWMLIPKPLLLWCKYQLKIRKQRQRVQQDQMVTKKIELTKKNELKEVLLDQEKQNTIEMNQLTETIKEQEESIEPKGQAEHHEEFEFGEIVVHQLIETIEFILGAISNTASYLRLWALSLAHGQLARVFFEKTIGGGIVSGSFLIIFIGWFFFLNITFGVIMGMDMMECFLHALRLQWVEFQQKFYKGDGYKFAPFSFIDSMKTMKQQQSK